MTPSVAQHPASQQPSAAVSAAQPARSLDRWIFPALGVLSLIVSCILYSLHKQEWADEVFSRTELSDRSLPHLMHALMHLGGAGMPLFSLTAWPWARLFGLSDLSLRLYSCAGVCGAFLVLLFVLRRRLSGRASLLGVAFAFFACMVVTDQNAEARGYGLYLFLCALAIAELLRVMDTPRPAARDLLFLALTQAGMVLGHVLALIFCGLLLLALVAADIAARRLRWRVWLCFSVGWLAILPWIPAIRASAAIAKPYGWLTPPTLAHVLVGLSCWFFSGIYHPLLGTARADLIGCVCGIVCVGIPVIAALQSLRKATPARRAVLLVGLALTAAPLPFILVSYLVSPIWVARYMIPMALGMAMLAASWFDNIPQLRGKAGAVLGVILLLLPIAAARAAKPDYLDVARVDRIAAGRPLVCDWTRDFMVMVRYSSDPATLEYPLDWSAALQGPRVAIGAYNLLQNYRREGYLTPYLYNATTVLGQKSFLVLDSTDTNWFQLRIAGDPRYEWKQIAQIDATRRIYEVRQRPASN